MWQASLVPSEGFYCAPDLSNNNALLNYMHPLLTGDVYKRVVFLYEMVQGRASGSYGLNVAALAGIPVEILSLARDKSKELQLGIWQSLSRYSYNCI